LSIYFEYSFIHIGPFGIELAYIYHQLTQNTIRRGMDEATG